MIIPISQIKPLKKDRKDRTTRSYRDHKAKMLQSIATDGLLSPIKVRRCGDGYRVVCGQTRLDCMTELGKTEIEAEVLPDDLDEFQELNIEVTDNNLQHGFDTLAMCEVFSDMMKLKGWTAAELSRNVPAITESTVSKYQSISDRLVQQLKDKLVAGDLGFRLAYGHSRLPAEIQEPTYERVKHMKVEAAERHIAELLGKKVKPKGKAIKVSIPGLTMVLTLSDIAAVRAAWDKVNAGIQRLEKTGFPIDNLPGLLKS